MKNSKQRRSFWPEVLFVISIIAGVAAGGLFGNHFMYPMTFYKIALGFSGAIFGYWLIALTQLHKPFEFIKSTRYNLPLILFGSLGTIAVSTIGIITEDSHNLAQTIIFGVAVGFFVLMLLMTFNLIYVAYKIEKTKLNNGATK